MLRWLAAWHSPWQIVCLTRASPWHQVREELINYVCNKEMAIYTQIFTGTGQVVKLEKTERRYSWLLKVLRDKEKVGLPPAKLFPSAANETCAPLIFVCLCQKLWEIFPKSWRVQRIVCMTFCSITRAQISEILDHQAATLDVQALLQVLIMPKPR